MLPSDLASVGVADQAVAQPAPMSVEGDLASVSQAGASRVVASDREVKGVGAKVAVIGGGIAGIQAALDLAEAGIEVYLVERRPAIGGVMAQLDKTFPTNDCSI